MRGVRTEVDVSKSADETVREAFQDGGVLVSVLWGKCHIHLHE